MSRRHQVQGRRPGVHPPTAADGGAPPLTVKTRPCVATRGVCIAGRPSQAPRPRACAREGGAPAVAGSAPWRRRGEEERGWWGWAVEIGDSPGGAPTARHIPDMPLNYSSCQHVAAPPHTRRCQPAGTHLRGYTEAHANQNHLEVHRGRLAPPPIATTTSPPATIATAR
jgi:hypothetical protein